MMMPIIIYVLVLFPLLGHDDQGGIRVVRSIILIVVIDVVD